MKMAVNAPTVGTADPARPRARRPLLALCFLLPLLMGGCPEFRNDVVGMVETATRSALLGSEDRVTIVDTATLSFVDATISLVFSGFRGDTSR